MLLQSYRLIAPRNLWKIIAYLANIWLKANIVANMLFSAPKIEGAMKGSYYAAIEEIGPGLMSTNFYCFLFSILSYNSEQLII